jgi:hypothetical protein
LAVGHGDRVAEFGISVAVESRDYRFVIQNHRLFTAMVCIDRLLGSVPWIAVVASMAIVDIGNNIYVLQFYLEM